MAKIVPSKNAPSEEFYVSFGAGIAKPGDETDNRALLIEAANHPWLEVEYDEVEMLGGDVIPPSVDPKDDPLSMLNEAFALAFDPAAVKADTDRVLLVDIEAPAAIDPSLDQDTVKTAGVVDKTVAAVEKSADEAEKAGGKTSKTSTEKAGK